MSLTGLVLRTDTAAAIKASMATRNMKQSTAASSLTHVFRMQRCLRLRPSYWSSLKVASLASWPSKESSLAPSPLLWRLVYRPGVVASRYVGGASEVWPMKLSRSGVERSLYGDGDIMIWGRIERLLAAAVSMYMMREWSRRCPKVEVKSGAMYWMD